MSVGLSRSKPLRAKNWCRKCGRTICGCGEPPKLARSRVRPISPNRERKREHRGVKGSYHDWIGTLPCELWSRPDHKCAPGTVVGHHVTHTNAGGVDHANEIPLCRYAHTVGDQAVHNMGPKSFEERWGVDMRERAEHYARIWDSRDGAA